MASFDGVAKKGKTKCKYPKMGAGPGVQYGGKGSGGVTSKSMKEHGRNMARAMNQKGG